MLWLGTDNYGGDYTLDDLAPLIHGSAFPKLEYLGLMNSEMADDIAEAIAQSPVLDRLKGLDLSMGTLSDRGGLALLKSTKIKSLAYINLRHHYMSDEVSKAFKKLGIEVNVSDGEGDAPPDDRYCEVTE
jgi:hypothetical protein